ncbi:gamma-glutamyltransferase family protein [Salinicoccus hispanicus]|uniref:Gamma-glutamyltransferase n=1 Tax=Salinicoccus hispanicus TaxID=157225 RepID=A0A6N8U6D0_9STAP|nr:gamma-glutamyltransferase family protein [Salinicoccus hispanicus]MXQ51179.1 gamma-glutamyltransferase [Salinicoccus hispanicus]
MNHYSYPYLNRRFSVYAKNGMVATTHPIATDAGIEVMKQGGNAMDAAIATAATLTVVEPTSNGIGGDAFMIAWMNGKLHGMNASGRSPEKLSMEEIRKKGFNEMPKFGWLPVNVPGVPKAWASLIDDFGNLTLKEVLAPAIRAAREGFAITPVVAKYWQAAYQNYSQQVEQFEEIKPWLNIFGTATAGEIKRLPHHAATLEDIAETDAKSVYEGELADRIVEYSNETGGLLTHEDLKNFEVEYVDPISMSYKGHEIHEIPPNGQGVTALMALGMLKDDAFETLDEKTYHHQIEAIKQAFADTTTHVADPAHMKVETADLLDEKYLEQRRSEITEQAELRTHGDLPQGGTVYLATADSEGNMVSYIQSNYMGFGSGVVIPKTGLALHNRGHNFSMDETHANYVGGGKKPFHTIIPGFITKAGRPVGPFGVMGAFMQPQGHLQVAMNLIDYGMNPQSALDAPRWQFKSGMDIDVEDRFDADHARALARRGHKVSVNLEPNSFGRGQVIIRGEDGALIGGTESRTDGSISIY